VEVAIKKMIDTSQRIIRIKFSDYNCNSYFETIRKNHKSSGVYFRDDIRKDFEHCPYFYSIKVSRKREKR
jgi:hypothetical protein